MTAASPRNQVSRLLCSAQPKHPGPCRGARNCSRAWGRVGGDWQFRMSGGPDSRSDGRSSGRAIEQAGRRWARATPSTQHIPNLAAFNPAGGNVRAASLLARCEIASVGRKRSHHSSFPSPARASVMRRVRSSCWTSKEASSRLRNLLVVSTTFSQVCAHMSAEAAARIKLRRRGNGRRRPQHARADGHRRGVTRGKTRRSPGSAPHPLKTPHTAWAIAAWSWAAMRCASCSARPDPRSANQREVGGFDQRILHLRRGLPPQRSSARYRHPALVSPCLGMK